MDRYLITHNEDAEGFTRTEPVRCDSMILDDLGFSFFVDAQLTLYVAKAGVQRVEKVDEDA